MNHLPPLDAVTEAALRESIKRFGVLVPVAHDQHGSILDGHHRTRIAGEEDVPYRVDVIEVRDDAHAREIALTLNTDRRQLTAAQRKKVVGALREQGHSLRAIAGAVGVDPKTVRNDLGTGDHSPVPDRIVGRDGKSRPAKRATPGGPKDSEKVERIQRMSWIDGWSQRDIVVELGVDTKTVSTYAGAQAKPLTDELAEAKDRVQASGRWREPKPAPAPEPAPEPAARKRSQNWNGTSNDKRQRELRAAKKALTVGNYSTLLRLCVEMNRQSMVIEAYKPEEYAFDEATLMLIDAFHDDLITLATWIERGLFATQAWLTEIRVREKIKALRDTTGRTLEEAETYRRVADKLERKLQARLVA